MNKVELAVLVEKAIKGELTEKEIEKLLKALRNKYWSTGLDTFKERLVLSAYILFDFHLDHLALNKEARNGYIKEELEKQKRELSRQRV